MITPRLSDSGIEYLDKVWNFASGCKNGCSYCYAEKIVKRFSNHYPNGFTPTLYPNALLSPLYLKKPSRIGVCFMGDLFTDCPEFNPDRKNILRGFTEEGSYWPDISLKRILWYVIESCPQHTFVFLTKQPQNLIKFSPFPDNCWVGVSATDYRMATDACGWLDNVVAKIKYLSIEPFLSWNEDINTSAFVNWISDIKWLIIGAQTKPYKPPKIEWVKEIVDTCDKAKILVFIKNNLFPLFKDELNYLNKSWLRQEMPQC